MAPDACRPRGQPRVRAVNDQSDYSFGAADADDVSSVKHPRLVASYRFTICPSWVKVRRSDMAETATKLPVGRGEKADRPAEWRPFEGLRREVDRLFEDFQLGSWRGCRL